MSCPFCEIICGDIADRIIDQNNLAVVVRDGFPISHGHTLIIPKRHIASYFEATEDEKQSILGLLDKQKLALDEEHSPAAYNIGINDGIAAGQTVSHLHIHLIPRYEGDVNDPRGGVRWIIPDKAKYWSD